MNDRQLTKTNRDALAPTIPSHAERRQARYDDKLARLISALTFETAEVLESFSSRRRRAYAESAGVDGVTDVLWDAFVSHRRRSHTPEASSPSA